MAKFQIKGDHADLKQKVGEAVKMLQQIEEATEDATDEMKKGFKKGGEQLEDARKKGVGLVGVLKNIASTAGGFIIQRALSNLFTGMVGFSRKAVELTATQEAQALKLKTSLASLGLEWRGLERIAGGTINRLQFETGIGDEDQLETLGRLVGNMKDFDKSLRLLPTTIGIAAYAGRDFKEVANAVGAAAKFGAQGLKEFTGIEVDPNATFEQRVEAIIRQGRRFEIYAQLFGQTLGGRLNLIQGILGDQVQALFKPIGEEFVGAASVFNVKDMEKAVDLAKRIGENLRGPANELFTNMAGLLKTLADPETDLKAIFMDAMRLISDQSFWGSVGQSIQTTIANALTKAWDIFTDYALPGGSIKGTTSDINFYTAQLSHLRQQLETGMFDVDTSTRRSFTRQETQALYQTAAGKLANARERQAEAIAKMGLRMSQPEIQFPHIGDASRKFLDKLNTNIDKSEKAAEARQPTQNKMLDELQRQSRFVQYSQEQQQRRSAQHALNQLAFQYFGTSLEESGATGILERYRPGVGRKERQILGEFINRMGAQTPQNLTPEQLTDLKTLIKSLETLFDRGIRVEANPDLQRFFNFATQESKASEQAKLETSFAGAGAQ